MYLHPGGIHDADVHCPRITAGGANAPLCHGAGIRSKTLSDLVRKIEYVDVNGILRSVDEPAQLRAAAGSLGLLGIVTHITLEMDKMTYAHLKPLKQDVNLAIPPPPGYTVPKAIRKYYTPARLEAARLEFIEKAEKSYYSGRSLLSVSEGCAARG